MGGQREFYKRSIVALFQSMFYWIWRLTLKKWQFIERN